MSASLSIHYWDNLDEQQRTALLQRPGASQDPSVLDSAADIVAAVRRGGDKVLRELTQRFDNANISNLRVTEAEFSAALEQITPDQLAAIDLAIANVKLFHEKQVPLAVAVETMPGVFCERVSRPIDSVGLYVPAGTAPLPSAALMLAVPAVIAN